MTDIIEQARSILITTPGRFLAMAESLPIHLLAYQPKPGEWSALECLMHLLEVEEKVFHVRIQAFLDGAAEFPAFDPNSVDEDEALTADVSPAVLAKKYAAAREANLKLLSKITPADLSKVSRHSKLGQVTLGEMINHWAGHDLNHLVQAERALMQPFIAGCGPWKPYFADHEVGSASE